MRNVPFDQYQRYKNTEKVINNIRKSGEKFRILEVGANAHKNLEKFLPDDEVTYLDISLPEELQNDPKYILGDATQMEFDDNSFDIVIALDVYEHIPKHRRESFIGEIYRVSKKIALVAAPFNKPEVVEAEIRANEYYKTLSGHNHIWLYEHIDYELPCLDEVKRFIDNKGIDYMHFSHGRLNIWEKLTNMHLATVLYNSLIDYKTEIDNYYNNFIFNSDYDINGYRDYFVFLKEGNKKLSIEYNNEYISKIDSLETNFYNLLNIELFNINRKRCNDVVEQKNTIKLYIDYGSGFSEENTITREIVNNKTELVTFEGFNDEHIRALRLDPTEKVGKFEIKSISITDRFNNKVDTSNIVSNSDLVEDNIYYFTKEDPQIILSIDNVVKHLELTIKRIYDYSNDGDVSSEAINKLKNIIDTKESYIRELVESNNSLLKKVKQMKNKFFNK